MKIVRLKDGTNASTKAFLTGNCISTDRLTARNESVLCDLFRRTASGLIKGFYLIDNTDFKAIHRSPKQDGFLQLSAGFYKNGDFYPCYDIQMQTAKDLIREGLPSGLYAIIE